MLALRTPVFQGIVLALLSFPGSGAAPAADPPRYNHLKDAQSAYLRRASLQPVDWYPWSEAAFQRARELDRPLLVDVGAVWCAWCDLMDRHGYTKAEVAAYINANFVAVKVDYDAQEELAAKLQRAQAWMNLPAGLPLTMFVTPSGKLYYGGAYFPEQASGDKPAFRDALHEAARLYRESRTQVEREAFDLELGKEE